MIAKRAGAFVTMEPAEVTQVRSALGSIARAHQQPRGENTRDAPVAIGEGVEVGEPRHRFCGEVGRWRHQTLGEARDQRSDKSLGLATSDRSGRRHKPCNAVEADNGGAIPKPSANAGRRVDELCMDALQRGQRQRSSITVEVKDLERNRKEARFVGAPHGRRASREAPRTLVDQR